MWSFDKRHGNGSWLVRENIHRHVVGGDVGSEHLQARVRITEKGLPFDPGGITPVSWRPVLLSGPECPLAAGAGSKCFWKETKRACAAGGRTQGPGLSGRGNEKNPPAAQRFQSSDPIFTVAAPACIKGFNRGGGQGAASTRLQTSPESESPSHPFPPDKRIVTSAPVKPGTQLFTWPSTSRSARAGRQLGVRVCPLGSARHGANSAKSVPTAKIIFRRVPSPAGRKDLPMGEGATSRPSARGAGRPLTYACE